MNETFAMENATARYMEMTHQLRREVRGKIYIHEHNHLIGRKTVSSSREAKRNTGTE
jgi:hypothetical protein